MISPKLQKKFQLLEMMAFPEWQKATPAERDRICKELGEYEAKEIIKEIEHEEHYTTTGRRNDSKRD